MKDLETRQFEKLSVGPILPAPLTLKSCPDMWGYLIRASFLPAPSGNSSNSGSFCSRSPWNPSLQLMGRDSSASFLGPHIPPSLGCCWWPMHTAKSFSFSYKTPDLWVLCGDCEWIACFVRQDLPGPPCLPLRPFELQGVTGTCSQNVINLLHCNMIVGVIFHAHISFFKFEDRQREDILAAPSEPTPAWPHVLGDLRGASVVHPRPHVGAA